MMGITASPTDEDRSKHTHLYHRDLDGFRFVNSFFHFNDVLPKDGALVCVMRPNLYPHVNKLLGRWPPRLYGDHEMNRQSDIQDVMKITSSACGGFVEGTLRANTGRPPFRAPA